MPLRMHRPPWRTALAALLGCGLLLGLVAALALGLGLRREAARTGDPLAAAAGRAAAAMDPATPATVRRALHDTGVAARLVGSDGRVRLQSGPAQPWDAGDAGPLGRLATAGAGWSLRDGAIEATRTLPGGDRIVLRAPLPPGAGTVGAAGPPVWGAVGGLALLAGALGWIVGRRRDRRLGRLAQAARAIAAGRPAALPGGGRGGWRDLEQAMAEVADRAAGLQASVEARTEPLTAALAPLAHPVAIRTGSGTVRNDALERLLAMAAPGDAAAIEAASSAALAARGPVSRRLVLSDGRALELEGWAVLGGRVIALNERTEQERMAAVRRRITGAAARHLQAPVNEIQALAADLAGAVSGPAAATVRRMQGAADRMERLVGQLLRGTPNDPRARPPRLRPVGAAGLAYGLGAAFDQRLRDRGLRLETDLPFDLPPLRTDALLVHEILAELIANSARFTPRGGTITLRGRALPGRTVELAVTDTGPGVRADEVAYVAERFARGAGAAGLPGAGLGLGVAAALAERLGGRLTILAGPGGAACLELPAAGGRGDSPADAAPTPRETAAAP